MAKVVASSLNIGRHRAAFTVGTSQSKGMSIRHEDSGQEVVRLHWEGWVRGSYSADCSGAVFVSMRPLSVGSATHETLGSLGCSMCLADGC